MPLSFLTNGVREVLQPTNITLLFLNVYFVFEAALLFDLLGNNKIIRNTRNILGFCEIKRSVCYCEMFES